MQEKITTPPSPQIQFLEKIIALVVDDDEGGEVLDVDAPDRFHAEILEVDAFDLLDAVLGQARAGAADRAQVEAAVFCARDRVTRAIDSRRRLPRASLERIG